MPRIPHRVAWRNRPKSLRCIYSVALRVVAETLIDPIRPPYTGYIHARSGARTLFGRFRRVHSSMIIKREHEAPHRSQEHLVCTRGHRSLSGYGAFLC